MKLPIALFVLSGATGLAALAAQPSPYAGQEVRDIKALSAQEIDGLLAGKGMGFAKAAELNGYPGPAHVLELADELALAPEQRARTQDIFQRMEVSAQTLGVQLVEAERDIELLFRSRRAEPASLRTAVERVAGLQAQVRLAHLQAHLEQAAVLTPQQSAAYSRLRGYGARDSGHTEHGHKHQ
jgi:Spy/CpxP family protein refolding chaperone